MQHKQIRAVDAKGVGFLTVFTYLSSLILFFVLLGDIIGFTAKSQSFLSLSVVYRNAGQCSFSSDFIKVLLVSFIIAIPIICGFMINLCGSFFFYKISIILVCIVTFIVQ